jgi:hypothetical protein
MAKSRPDDRAVIRKPVTLGGQHRSGDGARRVFGDRMQGRSHHVKQGDLSGKRLALRQPDRSQSTHMSEEVG